MTDNDKNIQNSIKEKYAGYIDKPYLCFFYESNEMLNTIEPSVLAVNCQADGQPTDAFKSVISKNGSLMDRNYDGILEYMTNNKAEWALRVFDSDLRIEYPQYIKDVVNEYR